MHSCDVHVGMCVLYAHARAHLHVSVHVCLWICGACVQMYMCVPVCVGIYMCVDLHSRGLRVCMPICLCIQGCGRDAQEAGLSGGRGELALVPLEGAELLGSDGHPVSLTPAAWPEAAEHPARLLPGLLGQLHCPL